MAGSCLGPAPAAHHRSPRAFLRKDKGGECRPDDLATCLNSGCTVTATTTMHNPTQSTSTTSGVAACTLNDASISISVASCSGGVQSFTANPSLSCTGVVAAYSCTTTESMPSVAANATRGAASNATGGSRFTNVAILASSTGSPARSRMFDAASDASTYDGNRLQLSDLTNVTSTASTIAGVTTGNTATTVSAGWTMNYSDLDERTATSATVLGGCVLWSSVKPIGTGASGGCASAGSVTSYTYQADFITGAPNCAASFKGTTDYLRSVSRNVISPPPESAAAIEISASGAIRYSLLNVQPTDTGSGATPTGPAGCKDDDTVCRNSVKTGSDPVQIVYSLPLSEDNQQCRHVDATSCN